MLDDIPIVPVSLVIPGPYLYRVYFEEGRSIRQVFDFEVGVEDGLIAWSPLFSEALGGDLKKAEPIFDCISHLDHLQNLRKDPFSSDSAWKAYQQVSGATANTPGQNDRYISRGDSLNPEKEPPEHREVQVDFPVAGQRKPFKKVSFSLVPPTDDDQPGESERKRFVPLGIELTMPGLYKVDYKYGGRVDAVSFSVFKTTIDVETVDQERFFSMDTAPFVDHLFSAVMAFDRAFRRLES